MAMMAMQDYGWPYNIMELHNALQHAVANTQDGLISPADLPRHVLRGNQQPDSTKMGAIGLTSIDEVTKASLEAALNACGGNRRRAAQRLQLSLRTVYYMIKRYGLTNGQTSKIKTSSNGA
jgi:two-component system response regulator AtoC